MMVSFYRDNKYDEGSKRNLPKREYLMGLLRLIIEYERTYGERKTIKNEN